MSFESEGWQVQVFAPQPESMLGDRFKARAAVALQGPDDDRPQFGAIWGDGELEVDRTSRLGRLVSFTVTDVRFPDLKQAELEGLRRMLTREIPAHTRPIPIDWLLGALESEMEVSGAYNNDPPEIIYRERPSVLVLIDGEPQYETLQRKSNEGADGVYASVNKEVERVVNTPFLLARWKGGDHFLYGSGIWFRASTITGPWTVEEHPPVVLEQLASAVDTTTSADHSAGSYPIPPDIIVRTAPAELLDFDGAPVMKPLQHTNLLYATNTNDDVFLDIATQDYYLLVSGRWFSTRNLKEGPWYHVASDQLPTEFARIPEGSAKDGVLAHVTGTPAAREAAHDANIPQTACVDRKSATIAVKYDGDPRFERIEGTEVYEALNASTTVLRINDRYHVCDNAVWYDGPTAEGPWSVSTEVPAEVGSIPPGSAAYPVRYVYIYDHTADWVYVGYTPGYLSCYVQDGVVIYGTGYYYAPWPHYWHPHPWTWGWNMYYDPWIGWSFGFSWGWNWFYPSWIYWGYPYYGYYGYPYYGYPYGWWGPWGWCPYVVEDHHHYYGHRPPMGGGGRPTGDGGWDLAAPPSLYEQRPNSGVQASTVDRGRLPEPAGGKPVTRPAQGPGEKKPTMRPLTGDIYIDREGNVYRPDGDRTEQYQNGKWQRLPQTRPPERLNAPSGTRPGGIQQWLRPQDIQQQRTRGNQRMNDLRHYQTRPMRSPSVRPAPAPSRAPGRAR